MPTPPSYRPSPSLSSPLTTTFHHPHYGLPINTLLRLPSVDTDHTNTPGLHHGFALTACSIVAANASGYLSPTREPSSAPYPQLPWDHLLTHRVYYFHVTAVSGSKAPYPVCPEFRSWVFPHRRMLAEWAVLDSVDDAPVRDRECFISGCRDGLVNFRVVPGREEEWFTSNAMPLYNSTRPLSDPLNDTHNILTLRRDLHPLLSSHAFLLFPKHGRLLLHQLRPSTNPTPLLHNHPLNPPPGTPREFLYARFAHSIFSYLQRFLHTGPKQLVQTTLNSNGGFNYSNKMLSWGLLPRTCSEDAVHGGASDMAAANGLAEDVRVAIPVPVGTLEALQRGWREATRVCEEDRQLQRRAFPEMKEERVRGRGRAWEAEWYPGMDRVEGLKAVLRRDRSWVEALAGRSQGGEVSNSRGSVGV